MGGTDKRIVILGSTGSIGRQALEVISADKRLVACGLAAGSNWQLLAKQASEFRPQAVAITDTSSGEKIASELPKGVELFTGPEAMIELINLTRPDMVLTAVSGSAGLEPTLTAIQCNADIAVANKESLVMAGELIMKRARQRGIRVLPVDSEHSAIFQCLQGRNREEIRRVTLTASGGPFRNQPPGQVRTASIEEVLKHPTWTMGRKVTIDSATMINKALETIEAHWLFDLSADEINVVIHRESIVHGYVEFIDGSIVAQMALPVMTTPIAYALYYPERISWPSSQTLDLAEVGELHFEKADFETYPALKLGYQVIRAGGCTGAVLNAADEVAVEAFCEGKIHFGRIVEIVQEVLERTSIKAEISLETVLSADVEARKVAEEIIARDSSG